MWSFDNFKEFQSYLTHCCQVFLDQPCSPLPATSCCMHFFIQPSLQQTWQNQRKGFVCSVIARFFKHSLFNKLSDDILSLIFTLYVQRNVARSFRWSLWKSAVVRVQHSLLHNITLRTLPLLFKSIAWFVDKGSSSRNFPQVKRIFTMVLTSQPYLEIFHIQGKQRILFLLIFYLLVKHVKQVYHQ